MDATAPPLNLFQRLMRQWDHLHPYNAAQILKLTGQTNPTLLQQTWQETLSTLLLPSSPLTILPPDHSLPDFLSDQLNLPFPDTSSPFRPFLLQQDNHHYAGIVYHHYAADSVSIRMLLREWFLRTHAREQARREPFKRATHGYNSPLGPDRANWSPGGALLSTLRWAARNRHVARIENKKGYADFACRFALHDLGPDLVTPLLACARRHRATLNDLFLAVTAQVCDRHVPIRKSPRRPNLALGTIVDVRPYARCDLSDTFGLYLGFTSTTCTPADLADFPRLLHSIAKQSKSDKQTRVPLFSPIRMLAGLTVGKIYGPKKLIEFYRKRLPLAGGISNINLNRAWPAKFHPHPLLDYIRVSPTGPMMPVVFTPTTLGQNLNLGLTYRPSLIPQDRAHQMATDFIEHLHSLK